MPNLQDNRRELQGYVARKLGVLQKQHLNENRPSAKAQLACLRREATKEIGSSLDTWELEFGDMPGSFAGRGSAAPTAGEQAVHIAFTLYAIHQQSQDAPMFQRTNRSANELHGLGHAASQLAYLSRKNERGEQLEQGEMPRRLRALVTADSMEEVRHYARQLVHQFRSESIPLDYATFSGQLYAFFNPARKDKVRLEWGREFAQWRAPETSSINRQAQGNDD